MKQILLIAVTILMSAVFTYAQTPQPAKPAVQTPAEKPAPAAKVLTVQEILTKYRAALGGSMASRKITSTVATGTFSITAMGINGTVEIYNQAPNKQATFITLPGIGVTSEGFDGTEAWSSDPINGVRIKTGVELAKVKLDAQFDRDSMLEKIYSKMETKGMEKVEGRDAYVIVATPAEGSPDTWYFDANTFLMIRMDTMAESPQGKLPVQTYIDEYREVDGIKMPAVTRAVAPAYSVTIKIGEIKNNVTIDDAKFSKPKAQ